MGQGWACGGARIRSPASPNLSGTDWAAPSCAHLAAPGPLCTDGRRQHRCRSPAGSRNRCAGRVEPAGLRSSPRTSRAASAHPGRPHPPVPRADLVSPEANVSEESVQLIKFHGSYQQDNREARTFGAGKAYQFMMRTRQPGGVVTNQLYLVMDELADLVGGGRVAGWVGDGWVGGLWLAGSRYASWGGLVAWGWLVALGRCLCSRASCARLAAAQGRCRRAGWAARGGAGEHKSDWAPAPTPARLCRLPHANAFSEVCAPLQQWAHPARPPPAAPPRAVRQRHAAPDHAPDVPAARRAEAGPEDCLLHRVEEHGHHAGRLRRREPQRHGAARALQQPRRLRAGHQVRPGHVWALCCVLGCVCAYCELVGERGRVWCGEQVDGWRGWCGHRG